MRWSGLFAAILGFIIGAAPAVAEPESDDAFEAEEPLSQEEVDPRTVRGSNFYVWDEDSREAESWGRELRISAGDTPAAAGWARIAARMAARPPLLTDEDEREIAAELESSAARAGISPLGLVLCMLPSLDRTCLISSCATSSHDQTRVALARALAAPFDAVGVRGALDHLQNDRSAEVRKWARSAAVVRRPSLG